MNHSFRKNLGRAWLQFFALLSFCLCSVASAQTVNWFNWTAPAGYPNASVGSPTAYTYATGASGSLTLPDNTVVTASLTGEVINASCFTNSNSCPSGFNWGLRPAGTWTSANVPNLPPTATLIAQSGYSVYAAHALTFSQTVSNVVMNIWSLGNSQGSGLLSSYQFNQDFVILSQNPSCNQNTKLNCIWKTVENGVPTLNGKEGTGTIQFLGNYTSISWTVSVPEFYSGFNIGVTSASPPPSLNVTSVSPATGSPTGGDVITITGTGFTGATSITVGGVACTSFAVTNDTMATCTTPAGTLGAASVLVTTPNGTNAANALFTYAVPMTFTVGGSVTGLASSQSVTLLNNGGNSTTVNANGSFTFSTAINSGGAYAVTVGTQPTGQICTVTNGSGTATANVTNVSVTCVTSSYTIGGTVTGLATGQTLSLLNNSGNSTAVTANASFTFSTPVNSGGAYAVTVGAQPSGQTCTVTSGSGTASANVTNVTVTCITNAVAPIPTLSEWAMIFLASLMAMFAIHRTRRQ